MSKTICQLALLATVVSLAGCGLKGPLYFPKDEPSEAQVNQSTPSKSSIEANKAPATGGTSVQPAQ